MSVTERWPVTYDNEQLLEQIKDLCSSEVFPQEFFRPTVGPQPVPQQGDVIQFESGVPVILETGEAAVIDHVHYWLVIGNTCDFHRSIDEVPFSQIAPIVSVELMDEPSVNLAALQNYKYSRRFYVPPWGSDVEGLAHIADFQRIIPIHKRVFSSDMVSRVASLSFRGWVLLHCCLIRFLCRDDGRFD